MSVTQCIYVCQDVSLNEHRHMESRDAFVERLKLAVKWINKYKKKSLAYATCFEHAIVR